MSDLLLAAFAAETGAHVVEEPRERRFERFRRAFDEAAFRSSLATRGLRFIGRGDDAYPSPLRELHDPPPGLFVRGSGPAELLAQSSVAIVGARACSSYGAQVARLLGRELAAAGFVVVSGLARGIDGEAHRGALESGGHTIAVLGCGVDRDYPAAHAQLATRICERGVIASEYAPGVEPAPWRFPARKAEARATMRESAFLQCCPCRGSRQTQGWCGPGVVSRSCRAAIGRGRQSRPSTPRRGVAT